MEYGGEGAYAAGAYAGGAYAAGAYAAGAYTGGAFGTEPVSVSDVSMSHVGASTYDVTAANTDGADVQLSVEAQCQMSISHESMRLATEFFKVERTNTTE